MMKKGFTLIELAIVLLIVLILVMLLLPAIQQARHQSDPPKVAIYRCAKSYLETVDSSSSYVHRRYFAGLEDSDHIFKTFEFKQDPKCVRNFRDLFSQLETNKYYEVTSVDGLEYPIVTNLKEVPK